MLATAPYAATSPLSNDVCSAGCRSAAAGAFAEKEDSQRGHLRARHRRDQCYCCRQRFFLVVVADAQKNDASAFSSAAAAEPEFKP